MKKELTNDELRQIYRKLTGKRPVYAGKATNGYHLFLNNLSVIRFGKGFSNGL